jgi:hypothetical protein
MELVQTILGILFVLGLSCGGWIVWAVAQGRRRKHELALVRERELTKRTRLRIEADERVQERADRIYLDAVHRHTDPEYDEPPPKPPQL